MESLKGVVQSAVTHNSSICILLRVYEFFRVNKDDTGGDIGSGVTGILK